MNNSDYRHFLIISIDTLRADCINASPRAGAYKQKYLTKTELKTDVLDGILGSSLYFNNCFSAAPYTSASHAAYFTGLWPLHNGIYEFFNRKLAKPTIFRIAKELGYATIFQTDFPIILGDALGFTEGIDNYFVEDETSAFTKLEAIKNRPTLSFFHFGGVHYPYGFHTLKFGDHDYTNKVKQLEKELNIPFRGKAEPEDVLDETFRDKRDSQLLLRYKLIIERLYANRNYDRLFELYLEGINYFLKTRFDKFILKAKKFADQKNGLLVIFADHGEEWDSLSEGHHNTVADDVLRVPLMFYGKGIKPGVNHELVRSIDFAPTLMSLISGKTDKYPMDGKKLDLFKTSKSNINTYAISQVWTSLATKREISSYQEMSLKKEKSLKPLKTYLMAEVARTGNEQLIQRYSPKSLTFSEFLSESNEYLSEKNLKKLKSILHKYNRSKITNHNKVNKVETEIRKELRNLGYRV